MVLKCNHILRVRMFTLVNAALPGENHACLPEIPNPATLLSSINPLNIKGG